MLESQFAALELPSKDNAFIIDVTQTFEVFSAGGRLYTPFDIELNITTLTLTRAD